VAEGDVGTFIPTIVVTRSDVVTYRPTTMTVSRVSELPSGIIVASAPEFFTSKYTKDQVWDVQRSPAYPVAGRDWTLSGLKSALDASRSAIDWGNGRYLKFISEIDNTNSPTSLFDETTGKRYKISLNLYEQNGSLVKVASRWGNLIGKGAKGFMYVAEGDVGMFFPAMPVRSTDVITYRPTNLTVTQLSQIK
ncbi:MAG: hypothetical protein RIS47_1078, partial [Bacteroidota bacterium]